MDFEPHLLPVALVFAGDADAFAHCAIKTAEQLLQRVFTEGRIAAQLRLKQLSVIGAATGTCRMVSVRAITTFSLLAA